MGKKKDQIAQNNNLENFGLSLKLINVQNLKNTFARLLKLPNVTKPLASAGVGETGPASGDGV